MKYLLILTVLAVILYSCKENSQTEVKTTIVTVAKEKLETVEEKKFELFEDYTALKTKTEIEANFDSKNIVNDTTYYAEGMHMVLRTIVTNPKNGQIINFMFETDSPNEVSFVEAHYTIYNKAYEAQSTQNIESVCGISTGMSLRDLKEWNGKDFSFSGFGWDFGGGIFTAEQEKFKTCEIKPTLEMLTAGDGYLMKFIGDQEISTTTEGIMDEPIVISMLTFYNLNNKIES